MVNTRSTIDPTKSIIRSVVIAGRECVDMINTIKAYESVCKQYLTCHLVLLDNQNIIENMNIIGGEPVSVAFMAPPNDYVYSQGYKVLSLKGDPHPNNLKTIVYNIELVGSEYYQDRVNTVQSAHLSQTATAAAQQIFSQYIGGPLNIPVPSIGMIGGKDAYNVTNRKPFTAIDDIMKTMLFGAYKSGNVLHYRDRNTSVIAPLEYLMNSMGSQEYFIQKETWSVNLLDKDVYHAVIYAALKATRGNSGRASGAELSGVATQTKMIYDHFNAAFKMIPGPGAGGRFGSTVNMLGAAQVIQRWGTPLWANETAPHQKTMEEKLYSAKVRNGPQLTCKVPLQTGLNVTVGKGVTVQLLPPSDAPNPAAYSLGGQWFVTDLCHELELGQNSDVIGTTTMQCVKKP